MEHRIPSVLKKQMFAKCFLVLITCPEVARVLALVCTRTVGYLVPVEMLTHSLPSPAVEMLTHCRPSVLI